MPPETRDCEETGACGHEHDARPEHAVDQARPSHQEKHQRERHTERQVGDAVGAQGLMQVLTRVHDEKYVAFGGNHAAFDPVTNLRVGVQVLKECISRAGGIEAGLRFYVGAANLADDGGYAGKVLAEQDHLRQVAAGKTISVTAPLIPRPTPVTLPATLTGPDVDIKPTPAIGKPAGEQVALVR